MRKLHLVGITSDGKGLIFSARRGSKSGGFLVPIEDALLDSLAAEQRRRNGLEAEPAPTGMPAATTDPTPGGRPQSTLTPREMQARLRAGRSIAEVAAEAHVTPDWVARFAVPILAEQAQMVELARSLTYVRPRGGESAEPLGPSVAENLAERGVLMPDDVFDAAWSAFQLHDVVWVVRVRYRSRGRLQEATWEVNVATGQLTSRNRLASDLAFVEKGRRRRPPARPLAAAGVDPEPLPEPPRRRSRPRTGSTVGGRSAAPSRASASAKRAARGRTAGSASRAPASNATTSNAAAGRRAGPAARKAPARKTPARRPTAASRAAPARKTAVRSPAKKAAPRKTAAPRAARKKAGPKPRSAAATGKAAAHSTGGRRTVGREGPTSGPATGASSSQFTPSDAATAPDTGNTSRQAARTTVSPPVARPMAPSPRAVPTTRPVPPPRVGTDGTPPPQGRRSPGGPPAPGPGTSETGLPSPDEARRTLNRLASQRVAASRAEAGRLAGDRRAGNPSPPPDPSPSPRGPGVRRPQPSERKPAPHDDRAAMTAAPPPERPAQPIAFPPSARGPIAMPPPRPAESRSSAAEETSATPRPAPPPPPAPAAADDDFEIDELLEPSGPERLRQSRPVIVADRASRSNDTARAGHRPAGTGPFSPWPVGTG